MAEGGDTGDDSMKALDVPEDVEWIEREAEQKTFSRTFVLSDLVTGESKITVQNANLVTTGDIHINNYHSRSHPKPKKSKPKKTITTSTERPDIQQLHYISENLATRWKQVGRTLGFEDSYLEQLEHDNHMDSTERNYQMLKRWMSKEGDSASKAKLAKHLNTCHMGKLVDCLADEEKKNEK